MKLWVPRTLPEHISKLEWIKLDVMNTNDKDIPEVECVVILTPDYLDRLVAFKVGMTNNLRKYLKGKLNPDVHNNYTHAYYTIEDSYVERLNLRKELWDFS